MCLTCTWNRDLPCIWNHIGTLGKWPPSGRQFRISRSEPPLIKSVPSVCLCVCPSVSALDISKILFWQDALKYPLSIASPREDCLRLVMSTFGICPLYQGKVLSAPPSASNGSNKLEIVLFSQCCAFFRSVAQYPSALRSVISQCVGKVLLCWL